MRASIKKFLNDVRAQAPGKRWAWETINDALEAGLARRMEGFDQPYPYALTPAGEAASAIPQTFTWVASEVDGSKVTERYWKAPRLGRLAGVVVFDKMHGERYEVFRRQGNGLGGKSMVLVARVKTQKELRQRLSELTA